MKFRSLLTIMLSFIILLQAATSNSQEVPGGECGEASGGALCDEGRCCSKWGFCGDTNSYCALGNCTSQCWASPPPPSPPPPSPPPPSLPYLCGIDYGFQKCPEDNMCCTVDGVCAYHGSSWCDAGDCQNNCNSPPDCGGGTLCPANHCCTIAYLCAEHSSRACHKHCEGQCPILSFKNKMMISMLD